MSKYTALRDAMRARSRATSTRPLPSRITIKITGRCNLRCAFCEIGARHEAAELPYEIVTRLIRFAALNGLTVFLWGGEPFLHSRIWDILAFSRRWRHRISLVTNGTLLAGLSDERQRLLNDAISMMSLSIDSDQPTEHDGLRGVRGTFAKASAYLSNPNRTHALGLNAVLAVDFHNAAPMVELAARQRTSVNFQPILFETNFPNLPRVEWKVIARKRMAAQLDRLDVLRRADSLARTLGVVTNLPLVRFYIETYYRDADSDRYFFDDLVPNFTCFTPLHSLFVDEKGEIMPCTLVKGGPRIHDADWLEAWRAQSIQFRDRWAAGNRYSACKSCSCHFAENLRCNVVAHPLANVRQLGWFLPYYARRWLAGEGRAQ